jgi:hypothetical protein
MAIPIFIPIGVKHVSAVQGAFWKLVFCEHCQQKFAYLLELEATGEDHDLLFLDGKGSAERARENAEQNLAQKGRNCMLPVPCPNCGVYQDEMAAQLKEEAWINRFQIVGLVVVLLAFIPLAFNVAFVWVLTLVIAAVGLTLVVYGYVVAYRFDPNAGDAEPRKALGRKLAIRGEQLELLVPNPGAESGDIDKGDRGRSARINEDTE